MNKRHISTHILDTTCGRPAADVPIKLFKLIENNWQFLSESKTLANGRCEDLLTIANAELTEGLFKLSFQVSKYFESTNTRSLYPIIDVIVDITNANENYHLPLLLNPYGYSTYRGS